MYFVMYLHILYAFPQAKLPSTLMDSQAVKSIVTYGSSLLTVDAICTSNGPT